MNRVLLLFAALCVSVPFWIDRARFIEYFVHSNDSVFVETAARLTTCFSFRYLGAIHLLILNWVFLDRFNVNVKQRFVHYRRKYSFIQLEKSIFPLFFDKKDSFFGDSWVCFMKIFCRRQGQFFEEQIFFGVALNAKEIKKYVWFKMWF